MSILTPNDKNILKEILIEKNRSVINSIIKSKCNFDVEIAIDMVIDAKDNLSEIFVLWSGDSDFAESIKRLLDIGKKVYLFSTAGRVSPELFKTGIYIYDIQKIKDFICWNQYIPNGIKKAISF